MNIRVRLVGNADVSNKPEEGYEYTLVFISGSTLAECLGNESTTEFHIYDNGKLFGNLKSSPTFTKPEMLNQIKQLELSKVIKIGKFKVTKIILWGSGNTYFSLHGEPILFDKIIEDDDTLEWQKDLYSKIQKHGWSRYIEDEKKDLERIKQTREKNLEEKRQKHIQIENDGWDRTKPLNINNHPPDMKYPPNIWKDIPLELSKNNKTLYKNIYSCSNNLYYFKMDQSISSVKYNSPVIAAYEYALWKKDKTELEIKEKRLRELYPNKRYITCPYSDKDECKRYGGKWDNEKKMWYIPEGIDNELFKKWL